MEPIEASDKATAAMPQLEQRLKRLIVDALALEDVRPDDIESSAPLFVEGLGLDSIDALELAMAIEREFGVTFSSDDEQNKDVFQSVDTLVRYISAQHGAQEGSPS